MCCNHKNYENGSFINNFDDKTSIESFKLNGKQVSLLVKVQSRFRGLVERRKLDTPKVARSGIPHNMFKQQQTESLNQSSIQDQDDILITEEDKDSILNIKGIEDDEVVLSTPVSINENGFAYYGEINSSTKQKHGRGILVQKDGKKYEGYWKNNLPNIKGKSTDLKGNVYDGEYLNGKAHGYGILIDKNKYTYEGMFINDKQHGLGKETWIDGTTYNGDFINGQKSGKGEYRTTDGTIYIGEFQGNQINGKGKIFKFRGLYL